MNKVKKLALATATVTLVAINPLLAGAEDRDLSQQLGDKWHEGAVWSAIAFNRHLSPFSIDVDVDSGTATLTGTVESDVDRDLAEQVALGIEGIERVDNQLTVETSAGDREEGRSQVVRQLEDATLTATVKSKLLWNSNTAGLDIHVVTETGVVTLTGIAESPESRELAGRLAENTGGVRGVVNRIEVVNDPGTVGRAQETASELGNNVSDAWITSKVKSSLVLNRNLQGLDIQVRTRDGAVQLSGEVASDEEKALAIDIARNIRGVESVSAGELKVQG